MNKSTQELYVKYAQLYKAHANQYADMLTGSANNDFYLLLQSEYKKDLKEVIRREREQLKAINKLYKMKIKADRRILGKRKARVDFELDKIIAEQVKSNIDTYLTELFAKEETEAVDEPVTDEILEFERTDETPTTPDTTADTTDDKQQSTEELKQDPDCCNECSNCSIDENGQSYCSKYEVDLDDADIENVCACEQVDFFETD